ncbi:hypothetical protein OSTOST_06175, partial [Ostertagia ostertagi]
MWRKPRTLANYFSNVFSLEYSDCWQLDYLPYVSECCTDCVFHPHTVSAILKKLHPSTTEPYDGIPQLVYKKCHASLSKPLSIMFNLSFLTGDLPKLWKHAIVTSKPRYLGVKYINNHCSGTVAFIELEEAENVRDSVLVWHPPCSICGLKYQN